MAMTCERCKADVMRIVCHGSELWCGPCHEESKGLVNQSAGVIPDGIPGGIMISNGICHEDGSPKRYDSRSEIKKAAFEKNLFILGDTPKPNQKFVEENRGRRSEGMEVRNRR